MKKIDKVINTERFKKTMGKLMIVVFLVMLLALPYVSAETSFIFKKDTSPDLKISCFDVNRTLCNAGVTCSITITDPDGDIFVDGAMNYNNTYFNITLPTLTKNGVYPVQNVRCSGNTTGFSTFSFEVTPTGREQTSILDNPTLLIFALLALILVGMGVYFTSAGLGFLGSIMFILGGLYTMIYGFNNVTDLYTRGVGGVFIGLGFIFMFMAAYEWIWGRNE